jgi:hypothetical protein
MRSLLIGAIPRLDWTIPRRNAAQPASVLAISMQITSRRPTAGRRSRPSAPWNGRWPRSRTFRCLASSRRYGNSFSSGRQRKASTCSSSSRQIRETWFFDMWMPSSETRWSTLRVETPFSPLRLRGIASSISPTLGRPGPGPVAVSVGRPRNGDLASAGADLGGDLRLHQLGGDRRHRLPQRSRSARRSGSLRRPRGSSCSASRPS